MAKRKRRKTTSSSSFEIKKEVYAIAFLLIAIVGIGKLGPVGKFIASFSLFMSGSAYMVLLGVLFIIGAYTFIKGEFPDVFSNKFLGLYLFIIGVLSFMHWEFIELNDASASVIFKETINELTKAFNTLMATGTISDTTSVGGGFIGGLFALIFSKLFSDTGMKIISVTFMAGGFLLFTGFSISDYIRDRFEEAKELHEKNKEEREEKKEEHNTIEPESKKVKISNGNEIEESEKLTIKSVDELKKIPANEVVSEKTEESKPKNYVNPSYQLPPLDLLDKPKGKNKGMDNAQIEANIGKLEEVLKSFGVFAKVVEVHVGPTVAQYELEIATGTRVNKITTLSREIALALSKKDVRIEAPIPGKNTVGIEFANDSPSSVSFFEIMASKAMLQEPDKKLMVPLGKSIMGEIGTCEINKMPHLLIAGTTGSGKSVCVNGIICSILMRARPDEVKLAMVDPKMVELSVYNGIPHLMCPVVIEPKKASILLQKMVNEMEQRYLKFSASGTKKIEGYNEYVEKYNKTHQEDPLEKMPYIVIVIDELSDLMVVAAKEVEDSILRITQKARAAGIHLIVATQRPSTEVVTGLIKANIPSRIAFAVGSGIDSRTILDQTGAEKLLGKGDMLYLPIGQNAPTRIQGSFITDEEIERIINFTKSQQEAQYSDNFMKLEEVKDESNNNLDMEPVDTNENNLYDEVKDFVIKSQKASASLLQRKFKIGYNRAATLIDQLEEDGIIGPATGNSKPREVLYQYDEKNEE
ncbi:MAG: cell division protein FtsK [Bacilli bacterium]|nr:cell division protein FtsK [Bacilli bacterium]